MTAESMIQPKALPKACYFDPLNLSLAKHLKHINLPKTEGCGKATVKTDWFERWLLDKDHLAICEVLVYNRKICLPPLKH